MLSGFFGTRLLSNICSCNIHSHSVTVVVNSFFKVKFLSVSSIQPHHHPVHRAMSSLREKFASIPDVQIDHDARYKYVLIQVTAEYPDGDTEIKHIVRGDAAAAYHADIYDLIWPKLHSQKLDTECLGGGRILHQSSTKTINVYGYSMGFGRADHKITCDVLKKRYPDYEITWSNDGY